MNNDRSGILFQFLVLLAILSSVFSMGYFDVNVLSVENTGGRLSNGLCCNNGVFTPSNDSTSCPGICDTAVRVCLSARVPSVLQNSADTATTNFHCDYGEVYGERTWAGNSFRPFENSSDSTVAVPFTFSWPGSTTLVVQLLHRRMDGGQYELIHQFLRSVEMNASADGRWTSFRSDTRDDNGDTSLTPIVFSFQARIRCETNYYGPFCNVRCAPQNDTLKGHYECDSLGRRSCLPGWKNIASNCNEPICAEGCQGGCDMPGECSKCPYGWTGEMCDRCKPYPGCVNGYCRNPHECICYERWGGLQCTDDQDYCYHKSPCHNGASCVPFEVNNYKCICPPGFSGRDCEVEKNPCANEPCLNSGICVAKSRLEFVCVCSPTRTGPRCEHLLAAKGEVEACVYDGKTYEHGENWLVTGCRRCQCVNGYTNCSNMNCQTGDCLQPSNRCLDGQHCSPTTGNEYTCLRQPCGAKSYGRCFPNDLNEADVVAKRVIPCEDSSLSSAVYCNRFALTYDSSLLPAGTYVDEMCYHLMVYFLESRFAQFYAFCSLDTSEASRIIVKLVSMKNQWPVNGLKEIVQKAFREHRAAFYVSAVLRAITAVDDFPTERIEYFTRPPKFFEASTEHSIWKDPVNRAIISSTIAVIVAVLLLAGAAYFLWKKVRAPFIRKTSTSTSVSVVAKATPAGQTEARLNNWTGLQKQCNLLSNCRGGGADKTDTFATKQCTWLSSKQQPSTVVLQPSTPTGIGQKSKFNYETADLKKSNTAPQPNDNLSLNTSGQFQAPTVIMMEASV